MSDDVSAPAGAAERPEPGPGPPGGAGRPRGGERQSGSGRWSGDLAVHGRYHVVGAGGSGMSAIASVLAAMGHEVSGSDTRDSVVLRRLDDVGVRVWVGHRIDALNGVDAVTASTAVPADDAELAEARRLGIPVLSRAKMLAAICATRRTLAVAGTHGKTTTSSMLAAVLVAAGVRPSFIVGGDIVGIGPGARWDEGEWLVVEADESDGTFLALNPEGVIVTSVEADHLDFYGDVAHLEKAFETFISSAPGPRVVCVDGAEASALLDRLGEIPVIRYGSSDRADVRLTAVTSVRSGVRFDLDTDLPWPGPVPPEADIPEAHIPEAAVAEHLSLGPISLRVPGRHNAANATAALTLALAIGVDLGVAVTALELFGGVARRFEVRGERDGVTFVDDYGHLPSEVAVTVATAATGGWERVVAIFQPHRYSRTAALWEHFADSFVGADVVIVTDVYPSGETPQPGITGALVAEAVRHAHPDQDVRYVPTRPLLLIELQSELRAGDLCLTLGAGDLTTLPDQVLIGSRG